MQEIKKAELVQSIAGRQVVVVRFDVFIATLPWMSCCTYGFGHLLEAFGLPWPVIFVAQRATSTHCKKTPPGKARASKEAKTCTHIERVMTRTDPLRRKGLTRSHRHFGNLHWLTGTKEVAHIDRLEKPSNGSLHPVAWK